MDRGGALSAPAVRAGQPGGQACQLWGVLNVTPDSFSDGGRYMAEGLALTHAARLLEQGADVIDVGGASSRPRGQLYGAGAAPVTAEAECARVLPVIEALSRRGARVSIDTVKPEVARAAIAAGARIVNDISCGASPELLRLAAEHDVEYVLMHTRGQGEVEPPNTTYADVLAEVERELQSAVERALACGIDRDKLWIDPGIGFAKTAQQSAALLAGLSVLARSGLRVLCGPSRKGFIAEIAPMASGRRPAPEEREPGTIAAVTIAVLQGASAVRVHDVAGARQAVLLAQAVRGQVGRSC